MLIKGFNRYIWHSIILVFEDHKSICAGKNRKNTVSFLELAKANIIAAKIIKAKHAALLPHLTSIQYTFTV